MCLVLGFVWVGVCAGQNPQDVEGPPPNGVRKITLRQMLKTGLKCRRPEDFQYANTIADLVDIGYLRRHMVLGTFFWARQQSGHIPLPYFQQALFDRAKKDGKVVPPLEPGPGARGF
jgi:hypothetical protein